MKHLASRALKTALFLLLLWGLGTAHAKPFHFLAGKTQDVPNLQTPPFKKISMPSSVGKAANTQQGLEWKDGYFGWELSATQRDFSDFDVLQVSFLNFEKEDVAINVEIKDAQSHDYWTRVNFPILLRPGFKTYQIPLRIAKGESARPGPALDRTKIQSIVFARSPESPSTKGTVFLLELKSTKKENPFAKFSFSKGFRAFDFGPVSSEVFDGFEEVTPQTLFHEKSGVGFVDAEFWQPYPQATNLNGPDSLDQDSIILRKGEFWVTVPPGEYDLVFNVDHPGGFWGEVPYFKERTLWVNGQRKIVQRQSLKEAADRYFAFDEEMDRVGDNFYKKYWAHNLPQRMLTSVSAESVLKIRFENSLCPQTSCFGMAPSFLIVSPSRDRKLLFSFLQSVRERQKKEFDERFSFVQKPTLQKTSKLPAKRIFEARPEEMLREAQVLNRPLDKISSKFLSGEPVHLSLGVQNLEKDRNLKVSWIPGALVPGGAKMEDFFEIGISHFRIKRQKAASQSYSIEEKDVFPQQKLFLKKGDVTRVWLLAKEGTLEPGIYSQKVKIELDDESQVVEVEAKVLDFKLPMPPFLMGPFFDRVSENFYLKEELLLRQEGVVAQGHKLLKKYGFQIYSIEAKVEVSGKKSLSFDFSQLIKSEKVARSNGLRELVLYSEIFRGFDVCYDDPLKEFAVDRVAFLSSFVRSLEALAKSQQMLPLTVILCDEASEEKNTEMAKLLSKIPKSERVQLTFTSSDLSHGSNTHAPRLPILSLFKNVPEKPWIFYNRSSQSLWGAGAFYLSQVSALRARLGWVFNMNTGNPFFALDGREDDLGWCRSKRDGKVFCDVEFYQNILGGMTTARYLTLLKDLSKNKAWALEIFNREMKTLAKVDWGHESEDIFLYAGTALKEELLSHLSNESTK